MNMDRLISNFDALVSIQAIVEQDQPITMINSFKGISIDQPVQTISVGQDYAVFQISHQIMSLSIGQRVFLRHPTFPNPIMARLIDRDLAFSRIILMDFTYNEIPWRERRYERVHPEKPTRVNIHTKSETFSACVADVCVNGMGVWAYKLPEKGINIKPDSAISVDYVVPDNKFRIHLKGSVVYIQPVRVSGLMNLGIKTYPGARQAAILDQYISQRKVEIRNELDQALNQAVTESLEPKSTKNLYF
jgi:hypothetical protein